MECYFFRKSRQVVNDYVKPALSVIELSSIAAGISVTDEMVKKAEIDVLESVPVCPGKYIIITGGEEGPIVESYEKAKEVAGKWIVDEIFIPNLHSQIIPAITAMEWNCAYSSIGIIETSGIASTVISADKTVKNADVHIIRIKLAMGIGGKGYFVFTGALEEVEAGMTAGREYPEEKELLVNTVIIPNPTKETCSFIL